MRVETIPERRVTGTGGVDLSLIEAALGMPHGIESVFIVVTGVARATMQISIAGRGAEVDSALDGLREFDFQWDDAGARTLTGIDSNFAGTHRQGVKWTAGPAACARILDRIAGDMPGCNALALPLGRWGIALGPDLDALDEVISANGGEASPWPSDRGAGGVSGIPGFEEFRRAFDPNMVLV